MKTVDSTYLLRTLAGPFVAVALAVVGATPGHAIIVYEDPGRLTTLPVLSGSVKPGWQYIGNTNGFGGVPIGPRAWVTATHVTGTASTGFWYNNAGTTSFIQYFGTRAAVNGDLAVLVLNEGQPDFQEWAPVWSGTNNLTFGQEVYMYGYGTLRGSARTGGWNWGSFDFALSYGTNQISGLSTIVGNTQFKMTFSQPTGANGLPGTEGIYSTGDSGSGLFSFNTANNRWELIGVNSTVEQVAATSGGAAINAALYDARGYYAGVGNTTLITGAVNVPLSSYAIALPYYESFLALYVAVPEPATWVLAVAGTGLVLIGRVTRKRVRASSRNGRQG